MIESLPSISELVPHRGRMLLLDRVLSVGEDSVRCELTLRPDSSFVEAGRVGAWVGIEYMAQAVAAYAGWEARRRGEPLKPGLLLGTRRYLCHRSWFVPGEVLVIDARRELKTAAGLSAFECAISVDGVLCAQATLSVYQPESLQALLDLDKA